jgi:hypothetical protein
VIPATKPSIYTTDLGITYPEPVIDISGVKDCPYHGHVGYAIFKYPYENEDTIDAYRRITLIMDAAVKYYECFTDVNLDIRVYYELDVDIAPSAFAQYYDKTIAFGINRKYMNQHTAMHEIAHLAGMGTIAPWFDNTLNEEDINRVKGYGLVNTLMQRFKVFVLTLVILSGHLLPLITIGHIFLRLAYTTQMLFTRLMYILLLMAFFRILRLSLQMCI